MWTFQVHETITGRPLLVVEPSEGDWRRAMGAGSGRHVIQLRDQESPFPPSVAQQIAEANATTFVVAWSGVPVYAGLIDRAVYSFASGRLTLNHVEGFRALLRERHTFGVSTYGAGNLIVSNRSASGVVHAILQRGIFDWGATWRLPVDLPADTAGGYSFPWYNYEWNRIDDLLDQIEKMGFEIDWRPYFDAAGYLRWETRVGSPLGGALFEFPVTVDESAVSKLDVTVDGTRQLTGCFYMGKGSEADMRRGEAGFVDGPGIPVRDGALSAKDVENTDVLNQMAMAELVKHRSATTQWDFTLTSDAKNPIDFAALTTGVTLRLPTYGDEFIPDGLNPMRLIGLSGDMTHTVTPEVQTA